MHPEIGDRHFPRGDECSSAGEQPGCDHEPRDELDQAGIPAGPGSELDRPCRADGPTEEDNRAVRGEEQTVHQSKQAQHGWRVVGEAPVESLRHTAHVTVAAQSSSRRHSRWRLDAMLWQCALSAMTMVVMSGLLQYRAASVRGSGETSTTP